MRKTIEATMHERPLSMTRASISPGATVKPTSRTACTIPWPPWKRTSRSRTSGIGAAPPSFIVPHLPLKLLP